MQVPLARMPLVSLARPALGVRLLKSTRQMDNDSDGALQLLSDTDFEIPEEIAVLQKASRVVSKLLSV